MKGTQSPKMKDIFTIPFRNWSPKEVKKIRLALGKSHAEFAEWFICSEDLCKAWEKREDSPNYREVYGPAARLMAAAAEIAKGKTTNLIRMAANGEL